MARLLKAKVYIVASLFTSFVAIAGPIPNSNFDDTTWRPIRVGAGGYVTGIDISPNGAARIVRTDTYGAYIWDETGSEWRQLVSSRSMPRVDVKVDNSAGVYEIRVAPSLPTRLYMAYRGFVYRSDDRGTHWSRTSFLKVAMDSNDPFRTRGQKMAIDPVNPDIVYVGTAQNGVFVTSDGGATWRAVRTIPVSQKLQSYHPGISGIAFDATSGVSGETTKAIFAASYGNGVYASTDAGTSWSAIGGPGDITYAAVSPTGIYYVASNNDSLWSYKKGSWKKLYTSGGNIQTVALNPFNPNEIVVQSPGGNLAISYNEGVTWSGANRAARLKSASIPWLANAETYMSAGGTAFDPVVQNRLWFSAGVGVWETDLPASNFRWTTPVTWNNESVGIEQLVATDVIAPPGGKPIIAAWDRPFFYIDDPDKFPSNYGPKGTFAMGWALDYASSDPKFIVGVADWGDTEQSGYSTDGGRTWQSFASHPPRQTGGGIAASTPTNFVWAPSNNSQPYYTTDGGVTWKQISIDGVPTSGETGWGWAYYTNRHIIAADRVTAGTFYIYNYLTGLYRSSDGGANWTLAHPGPISDWSGVSARLKSVPGHANHLFFTSGGQSGENHPAEIPLMRSTDGGKTWIPVVSVMEVRALGFGVGPTEYPAIFIVGWVRHAYGIWRSDDNARTWVQIADFPLGSLDAVTTIDGDKNVRGRVYIGFGGSGYAYGTVEK